MLNMKQNTRKVSKQLMRFSITSTKQALSLVQIKPFNSSRKGTSLS